MEICTQCWLLRVTSQVSIGHLRVTSQLPPPRVSHLPSPSHAGPPQRATGMKKRRDGRGRRDGASWTMATICIIGICITLDLTCVSFATSAGINQSPAKPSRVPHFKFRDTALEFRAYLLRQISHSERLRATSNAIPFKKRVDATLNGASQDASQFNIAHFQNDLTCHELRDTVSHDSKSKT